MAVVFALKLTYLKVKKHEGANDGLVSVESAKWKERFFKGTIRNADHFNELGWWDIDQVFETKRSKKLMDRIHKFYLKNMN